MKYVYKIDKLDKPEPKYYRSTVGFLNKHY